ncbi:MAG TPA: glycosyltransferase family A protein [Candidatus Dormibacteraeota bacterium]|nr:glycosyltransferase family A protein [Candidatus Dormibacteraeota bacterium]
MAVVSVIVPTRNSVRTLEGCLRSVRAQTYRDLELIVVDNHSLDGSAAIAERFADRIETWGPERSAQRNRGAELARGSYVLFVDSDMRLEPGVVSSCVATLEAGDAPAVIIPEVSVGQGFWAHCRALERSCYLGDDTIEAARFFRREVFRSVGGYDESLTGPEDWDLSARAAAGQRLPRAVAIILHDEGRLHLAEQLAKKWYYSGTARTYLRKHPRSLSQGNLLFRPAFFRNWRKLARHPLLTTGMFFLKGSELAAVAAGMLLRRSPSAPA